jgi:hypothetical protein
MYLLRVEFKTLWNLVGVRKVVHDLFPSYSEAAKTEAAVLIHITKVKETKIFKVSEYSLRCSKPIGTFLA